MDTLKTIGLVLIVLSLSTSLDVGLSAPAQKKDTSRTAEQEDISNIWLNTVWKDIDEIATTKKSFEVEKVTTVAGVRGAEAEDEATKHLYYRGSMHAPSRLELQEAIRQLEGIIATDPTNDQLPKLTHYVIQCYLQLGDDEKAAELSKELIRNYPNSRWTEIYADRFGKPESP